MLLVVLLKDILFLKVSEQHHDLIQDTLDVILRHALQALAQLVIHEQADVFRASLTQVDEGFKAVVQDVLERLVIVEGHSNDSAERKQKRRPHGVYTQSSDSQHVTSSAHHTCERSTQSHDAGCRPSLTTDL